MARPREFEIDEALEQAMRVFWAKGYEAASLHDLIEAMGLSKSSLYRAFGSKHELFLSTIDHYVRTITVRRAAALIAEGSDVRSGITSLFNGFLEDILCQHERLGCFLNNCAVEVAAGDPAAAKRVEAGLAHLAETFHDAVRRGRATGEIPVESDPRALARYLTSSLHGLIVMAKLKPDRQALEDVTRIVLSALSDRHR